MIIFKREGSKIICSVDDGNGWSWNYTYTVNDNATAEIVTNHFNREKVRFTDKLKERFYLMGYRDGKGKKRKQW